MWERVACELRINSEIKQKHLLTYQTWQLQGPLSAGRGVWELQSLYLEAADRRGKTFFSFSPKSTKSLTGCKQSQAEARGNIIVSASLIINHNSGQIKMGRDDGTRGKAPSSHIRLKIISHQRTSGYKSELRTSHWPLGKMTEKDQWRGDCIQSQWRDCPGRHKQQVDKKERLEGNMRKKSSCWFRGSDQCSPTISSKAPWACHEWKSKIYQLKRQEIKTQN